MTTETSPSGPPGGKLSWRFPASFWTANGAELFERAAFYGLFILQAVYFTKALRYTDVQAGALTGVFASAMYFLPPFSGILADRIGFRRALLLAFACLTIGYAALGFAVNVTNPQMLNVVVIGGLAIQTFGASIVKPVISGTVAKASDAENRARAFSIFYAVVNIGAFSGKSLAYPIRQNFGLENIAFYAAAMSAIAFVLILAYYRDVGEKSAARSVKQILEQLVRVVSNVRFAVLIIITAGFWTIQHQLYASMPKYMLRMVGEGSSPEWLANINPFMVVVFVIPITHLVRNWKPVSSIALSLLVVPLSALSIAIVPLIQPTTGSTVSIFGQTLHIITTMAIIGIALQGIAECFLSPKYLEFASKQAPPGEEGLYMGYTHLNAAVSLFFGFLLSGFLLDAFCPDPQKLAVENPAAFVQYEAALEGKAEMPPQYQQAHYIWYVYAGIGIAAFFALLIYKWIIDRIDARRDAASGFETG